MSQFKNFAKGMILFLFVAQFMVACKNDTAKTAETTVQPADSNPVTPAATENTAAATTATDAAANNAAPSSGAATPPATPAPNTPAQKPAATPEAAATPTGPTTSIKFDEMEYKWGTINQGDKMTHIFKFKNTGNAPLIISNAKGSCGCTVPEWPKAPVAPGKEGEMKVVFDSHGKQGPQTKTVTVTANTVPQQVVLKITGEVKTPDSK